MEGTASRPGFGGGCHATGYEEGGQGRITDEQKARGEIHRALSGSRCYNHGEHPALPLAPAPPLCRPVSSQMQHCPPYVGWLNDAKEVRCIVCLKPGWLCTVDLDQRFPQIRNRYFNVYN